MQYTFPPGCPAPCWPHGARRKARRTPPPGWPKTSGAFVLLTPPPGTLHAFDCGLPPLHVRLCDVDVAGIFTFGSEGEDQPALVREREVAATLTPDPP